MSVPRLRFPGFVGEWGVTTLGEVAPNPSYGLNAAATKFDGVHKYIRITDIDEKTRKFSADPVTSPLGEIPDEYRLKRGDLLFARTGASTGRSYLYDPADGNIYFAGFLIRFRISKADPNFVFAKTLQSGFDEWIKQTSVRSGQPGVNAKEFSRFRFTAPSLPEQKKIAAFLGVVDAKIAALRARVAGLETYKRGLMQALFSQRLRFTKPNGTAFPDWQEKRLGEVLKERRTFKTKGNGLPHISLTTEGVVPKSARYDRDFLVNDDEVKKYKITRLGDLCYNPANLKFGVIAMNKLGDGIFSPIYVTFELGDVNAQFLEDYVQQWSFQKGVRRYEQGTVYERQAVSPEDFLKAKVSFPHPDEQQKIADALSAMDAKITAVSAQVAQMQDFKKGLLQQMFV